MLRTVVPALALLLPAALAAQTSSPTSSVADRAGTQSFEAWAGYSDNSSNWGVLGRIPDLRLGMVAGRLTRRLLERESVAWEYTLDVVPIALISPPLRGTIETGYYPRCDSPLPCSRVTMGNTFPEGSGYGYGFSPLGITGIWRRQHAIQPRLGGTGGMLMFDRAVPTVLSTQFNFTASLEAGVQLMSERGDGIVVTYRFHHISNAGTGVDNSAVASHMISVGARKVMRR